MGLNPVLSFAYYYTKGWDHGISVQLKQINITGGLYCWNGNFLYNVGEKQNEGHLFTEPTRRVEKESDVNI